MHREDTTPLQSGEPFRTADDRPTFEIIFRPNPGVDGNLALRAVLKKELCDHGLVCLAAREKGPGQ